MKHSSRLRFKFRECMYVSTPCYIQSFGIFKTFKSFMSSEAIEWKFHTNILYSRNRKRLSLSLLLMTWSRKTTFFVFSVFSLSCHQVTAVIFTEKMWYRMPYVSFNTSYINLVSIFLSHGNFSCYWVQSDLRKLGIASVLCKYVLLPYLQYKVTQTLT